MSGKYIRANVQSIGPKAIPSSFVSSAFDAPVAHELGRFEPPGRIYETEFDRRLRLVEEGKL